MSKSESSSSGSGGGGGCGMVLTLIGAALAALCSWTMHHSIVWACVHAVCGWLYLLYLCMGCGGGFPSELPW